MGIPLSRPDWSWWNAPINREIERLENERAGYINFVNNYNANQAWFNNTTVYLNQLNANKNNYTSGINTLHNIQDNIKKNLLTSLANDLKRGNVTLNGLNYDKHMSYDGKVYISV
jgi:hypothetical protein